MILQTGMFTWQKRTNGQKEMFWSFQKHFLFQNDGQGV